MDVWDRFRQLLREIVPGNRFYVRKFADIDLTTIRSPADMARLPFTNKAELAADQAEYPPYGTARTYSDEKYCRLHQTSGTSTGQPLRWLDTPASWEGLLKCWQISFPIMGLTEHDRLFFPFSFGPFLGFWTAFEAATRSGYLCIPAGGMTSTARLRFLLEHRSTIVFATPTYALHLAELAAKEGIDLAGSSVRAIVVAGEPGGNIPATRARIEEVWGARVFDHYGMTEVGPVAIESVEEPGSMRLLETEYIAEIVEPNGTNPVEPGNIGELVITNLGRVGSPLIRYRTGDLVRTDAACGLAFTDTKPLAAMRLVGGILGRADDMIHVRGNNLYPTAIEAIVRRFPAVVEFRIAIDERGSLPDLRIELEPDNPANGTTVVEAVARAVRDELLFRVEVIAVPPGSLPRFEMKARRVVRTR